MLHQGRQQSIILFQNLANQLTATLRKKTQPFFLSLLCGILLAIARRRTVTTWLQAAQIEDDFRQVFYHMPNIGRKSRELYDKITDIILERLRRVIETATYIRIVLDDSPTKRYGKKIEGAGWHHNPTPGRTNAKICFGHSWVVAVLVVAHPLFGEISFPIAAELYLRKKEIDKLKGKYARKFKTKTDMAVEIVKRLMPKFVRFEKKIEVIVDGGYAKDTVLLPLGKLDGVITITRLRRDAVLHELPPKRKEGHRGRPHVYGERIDVKSKVESNRGWRFVECVQYGQLVKKRIKSFTATTRLTRGKPVKVVLIKEDDGTWVPLMSTDASMEVKEILEAYGVRFGIEEVFKDLKEVWGWGKQEVRKLESNEAATAMNMVLFAMTELSTWDRSPKELVDRSYRPWDDVDRRPSHADRRNFLRQGMFENEFNAALELEIMPRKIRPVLKRLMKLAA
jgi:SRSO17 transposase